MASLLDTDLASALEALNLDGRNLDENSSYRRTGCDIQAIISEMHKEQTDHMYHTFSSAYLKHRKVVCEWMIDVTAFFNLHSTTTHSAIAYLDRLQPNERFSRYDWQMLAICCILISSKYNECEEHVPSLRRLEDITQQRISNEFVLNYELWALKRIGWKLNARTPMSFLSSYFAIGVLSDYDYVLSDEIVSMEKKMQREMEDLATSFMLNVDTKRIPGSALAVGIWFAVREKNDIKPVWTSSLTKLCLHDPFRDSVVQEVLEIIRVSLDPTKLKEDSESIPENDNYSSPAKQIGVRKDEISTPSQDENEIPGKTKTFQVSPVSVMNSELQ